MSLKRHAARRDLNEAAIVATLRELGCVVVPISQRGVPDLAVGYLKRNHWVEVKRDAEQLNPEQAEWHDAWATAGERPVVIRTEAHARKQVVMWTREFAREFRTHTQTAPVPDGQGQGVPPENAPQAKGGP